MNTESIMTQPEMKTQIRRFCLYGFLKNLQFFEPFLILVFLDKGLSFTQIGVLIAFRAICVNVLEVPSGAIADTWGLRRSILLSMFSYIASFLVFAMADKYAALFAAMFCFALGEAFRTGTHKAIILNWLTDNKLTGEKTRIYGLTRSWSKQGSALNSIIAAAILISFQNYKWVFLLSIIPYGLNILNLAFYAKQQTAADRTHGSMRRSISAVLSALKLIFSRKALSSLIIENICFEGVFSVIKDYLQPVLKSVALSTPILLAATDRTRAAVLVAAVYFVLNQGSSMAARLSHRAARRAGSENRLGLYLWLTAGALYAAMLAGFHYGISSVSIAAFIAVFILLNVWKPVFVSRFHDNAENSTAATTLSIANQSKTLAIAVLAPIIGIIIDYTKSTSSSPHSLSAFWPVAAMGILAALLGLLFNISRQSP